MNSRMKELNLNEMNMVNGAGWGSFWNGVACGLCPGGGTGAIIGCCVGGPVGAMVGGGIGAVAGGVVGGVIGFFCGDD